MTGIERLRKLIEDYRTGHECDGFECTELSCGKCMAKNVLEPIADQIERETEERSARLYDMRVGEETDVCELFGVEPVDDPLTSLRRHVESLTDTVENLRLELGEARDDSAWVRDHGGLEAVKASIHQGAMEHGCLLKVAETLGTSIYDGAGNADALLDKLEKRLMPEGMEWLRYDTGEPVPLGGEVKVTVHDEDGDFDRTLAVRSIKYKEDGVLLEGTKNEMVVLSHGERVRRHSVLAADGEPLEAGQTVWHTKTGAEYWVKRGQTITSDAVVIIRKTDCDCESEIVKASQLTHAKPEPPDSAERIADEIDRLREEVALHLGDYLYDEEGNDSIQFSMECVAKRCRALAERERGE